MKVRTGFVSNSSSSSFIIIGEKLQDLKSIKGIIKDHRVICVLEGRGTSGDCEDYIFDITKDNIESLEKFKNTCPDVYIVYAEAKENDDLFKVDRDIKGNLYHFNKDYSSPENNEELWQFINERTNWL